jgi:hypothetical protein
MMFTIDGYRVWFKHDVEAHITVCIIEEPDVVSSSFYGAASCSPYDNFSREVGRKIALGRALRATGWPKETRKEAWHLYFKKIWIDKLHGRRIPHGTVDIDRFVREKWC